LALAVVEQLARVIERVRERIPLPPSPLRGQAQRFGAQAWQRITARWPALNQLIDTASSASSPPITIDVTPAPVSAVTAKASGTRGDEVPIATLKSALIDPDSWQNRVDAARALGTRASSESLEALLAAIRDPSAEVAVAVVDALTLQRDGRALQALREVLGNPDGYFSPITRVAALSGLAERLLPSEWRPIVSALRDVDAELSIAAIALIAERLPHDAKEHLLPLVRDESGFFLPVVRIAAASALERTGALTPDLATELLSSERDGDVSAILARAAA
jgi:HEAT repeat protein